MKTDSKQSSIRSAIVFQFSKLLEAIDNDSLHSKLGVLALKKRLLTRIYLPSLNWKFV